ncbi:A disintegrin and metallo ase with thrombospondin motifs 16 [Pelobates cultripes]|uniref:A disintegrin and metallo ase with thrombospondin motifs 16 n=1 Tax=Pelobates cultripes TaxID=61616 RepID=A0AAD1W257_PELCU|nr:A disintegrin and metallo ase with thrombospondin motifs 16 [Pelobates cultripes]
MDLRDGICWLLLALALYKAQSVYATLRRMDSGRQGTLSPSLHNDILEITENNEYDIVVAHEVDRDGNYITHEISHSHRRKRSLQNIETDPLHLNLQGLIQDFHLELKVSNHLLAPGFVIQTFGNGRTKSIEPYSSRDFCFYHGSILSHENSSVALSTCNGLSGLIRTQEADYFLKPLPVDIALKHNYSTSNGHQPHVLYKRSVENQLYRDNEITLVERQWELENHNMLHQEYPSHLQQQHNLQMDQRHRRHDKQHYCGRRKKYTPKPPKEDIFILPDEYRNQARSKRSLTKHQKNKPLNVETLVVVDKKMMDNHGHENITTYVLTILNMVSALFKDGTIGGNINIAIVGLILLEDEQPGLVINHHADHTLSSFCQWQSGLVGKDGSRHDHAILLTGLDICSWKNEPCDTLGFAPISGMCSKYRSCTVNEDTGLGLAFTIAHESGHNFGMVHDGEGNMCKKSEGNIMSPTLAGHNGVFSWSACSRQYLYKFLSSAQAVCLVDDPKPGKEYKYPEKLPGELYDANTQCKWQFGEKAKLCMLDFKKDICKALWCHRIGRKCETKFMPAAEGTICGHDMWCRRGQCVKHGDEGPKPTDGQWSDWSAWSSCSRTCGGGVSYKERQCNNPRPIHGGKFCDGSSRVFKLCNSQNCPKNSIDFRAQQCAEYNSKPFRGWYYNWKPYTRVEEQDYCKLYCIAEGFDFFFSLSNKVKDGTPCSEHNHNVCIDGSCEAVGCDQVLGSNAVQDACGICNGDNSTCKIYRNQYTKQLYSNQYYTVVIIPAGARSIRVSEMNISTSYIAVRNTQKKYYLNGHWTVDWPGQYKFAGSVFDYKRPYNNPENLIAAGPTNETIVVELLLQGKNPGISWEYAVPKSDHDKKLAPKHNYTWAIIRSECSTSCGGGYMNTKEGCYRDMRVQVNTSFCNSRNRPITGPVPCNLQACTPSWSVGNWTDCSQTCGIGEQFRHIFCTQKIHYKMETVANKLCPMPAPVHRQICNTQSCPPAWSVGPWSECSRTCGKGWKKRSVVCKSTNPSLRAHILSDAACTLEFKPKIQETCLIKRCNKPKKLQWVASDWSECSSTCGSGVQKRTLKCIEKYASGKNRDIAQKKCSHLDKPHMDLERVCLQVECPRYPLYPVISQPRGSWYSSPWSQCTVTCGGGVQVRTVQCLSNGRPASGCYPLQKPGVTQACNTDFCPPEKKDTLCKDYFNWCYLVPQHGVCTHKFYGKQCCRSCSKSNV